MSSAGDVESGADADHDDRLARAFDRVARLGIDLDPHARVDPLEPVEPQPPTDRQARVDPHGPTAPHEDVDPPGVEPQRVDPPDPADTPDAISERASAAVRAFTALNLNLAPDEPDAAPVDPPTDTDAPEPVPAGTEAPSVPEAPIVHPDAAEAASVPESPVLRPDAVLLNGRPVTSPDDVGGPGRPARRTPWLEDGRPADRTGDAEPGTAYGDPVPPTVPTPATPAAPMTSAPAPPAGSGAPGPGTAVEPGPPAIGPGASSRPADRYLLDLTAAAIAIGALVHPWAWLGVVAVGAVVGMTARSVADHGPELGPLLRRALRRMVRWLSPRSLVWSVVTVARTAVLAVAIPGIAWALWWVVAQGIGGAFVAGRMGAWTHGLRVAAAISCFMLVAGVGDAHQRRATRVGDVAGRVGRGRLAIGSATVVVVAVGVVTLVPRADAGPLAGADGLGWAPVRLRDNLDRLRDDVVRAELHAAAGCLSDRQGLTWRATYTGSNPPDDPDIGRLVSRDGVPTAAQTATAAAALHNQLAPWVEGVELGTGDETSVVLDRSGLPTDRPALDVGELAEGASSGQPLLAAGIDGFDRATALACSAAPVP